MLRYEKADDSVEKQVWLRQMICSRSVPSCMRTVRVLTIQVELS
ncbi:MAG: hypothetical protein ACLT4C_08380 [Butyricicoccus sp.]